MDGIAYVADPDQLQREAGALGDVADRCRSVQQALASGSLPGNAFGTTTHGPLISNLCAQFQTTVVDRMRTATDEGEHMSDGVREAALAYRSADTCVATDYGRIGTALSGAGASW
jgi:hypothetical protein